MSDLVILNDFGITPTKNFVAAGYDFYVPNIKLKDENDTDEIHKILTEFSKSFKTPLEEILDVTERLNLQITATNKFNRELTKSEMLNVVHLFYALTPPDDVDYYLESDEIIEESDEDIINESIEDFVEARLIEDSKGNIGINIFAGDYILINSGIKVGLPKDTAGIFFNKSGKGNQGFDTRACVVDEDYAGYVHLSMAYDKQLIDPTELYCGDKLSQFIVLPLVKTEVKEVSKEDFEEFHKNSQRGSDGFGSSDVKH
jgi:dUTPase